MRTAFLFGAPNPPIRVIPSKARDLRFDLSCVAHRVRGILEQNPSNETMNIFLDSRERLMRREVFVISIFLLAALSASSQQSMPAINYDGPGVNAPVLMPSAVTVSRPPKCEQIDGLVKLNAVIDRTGVPNDVAVISSDTAALNDFAAQWVSEQRFKPGTVSGTTAAISVMLAVGLHTCVAHTRASGEHIPELELSAHPFVVVTINAQAQVTQESGAVPTPEVKTEAIGGRVSAPIPTLMNDPEYPEEMKSKKLHGLCVLSVVVDAVGLPRDVRVVKQSEPAMDQSAIDTVKTWRFQPALKDSVKPVPVVVTVTVGYSYYQKQYLSVATYLPLAPDVVVAHLKPSEFNRLISPAVLLNADEVRARYMPRSRVPGKCYIAAVIGTNGITQNVRAVNSLDSSLGADLVDAVEHMRFKPAMKDGIPIPLGFVIAFRYSQRDMLRQDDGSLPWWMNMLAEGAILAMK